MCGIVGIVSNNQINQKIYDSLLLLQHRGQDSTGIATMEGSVFHLHKSKGQVKEAYRTRDMRILTGNIGIGHVRYATSGEAHREDEAQPFYVNAPYGIILVHNGNLTNTRELEKELFSIDRRHTNSSSDTEMLLNVLATEIQSENYGSSLSPEHIFSAISSLHKRVEGTYSAIAMIAGYGLLAFRDPYGIRPLVLGKRVLDNGKTEWIVASESLVLENNDFDVVRDVVPGEAIFISNEGEFYSKQCADNPQLFPCSFEYVYLARPDSVMNGISVYEARLRMGDYLAKTIQEQITSGEIDVVMPIPDSSRPSAMQVARQLGLEYREGFFKNRYVGRTFIMPGQAQRKKSVRQKLNAMSSEFKGKNVLLVDDSIVRGTTSREIVQMAKLAGANKVTFTSAAPPIRFPHVYGINMPSKMELIAHDKSIDQIQETLLADGLVYQKISDLEQSILKGSQVKNLDLSCFNGEYVTGKVTEEYLAWVGSKYSS
ncbi:MULTISPECIES: amidophosphoribosyltransferase [Prochlorococcus]|uniref:Amidophosphoribosyltransferase n=1 Tax=Prochlorococcus marinus (strain SARG / CCMP1375 / SS120) TaxID=167539 RepID=Q7VEK8_PROMA|nr:MULTISPECIES: amidophosphoribosyltransferase [Prochlorococcus]AAP99050.1 Glutamine phosphoribosylpyrophosphate amidotransferase [Prochlorococcus marinus subsp. marinus str. CCMP1375]KGG14416.1 Amidophosphoribosyltransferase [Prochlorococcus marinus str. LG]KGG20240.1 Amidophosphoribosyltransferase [Prochlorococcus marinus str. SS2]KGG23817.1 Amidophosphoribosyltransferase [Prochlorococcus marinus str. SS35]KGG37569.1 Amidophosphoribosyltransferase [Prochlorococcus sp. SS52]